MADTLYAWTDIKHSKGTLKAGETATANKLGVDEDEFEQLKEARVVRATKFPSIPRGFTGSPMEYVVAEHKKQLEEVQDLDLDINDEQDRLVLENEGASREMRGPTDEELEEAAEEADAEDEE